MPTDIDLTNSTFRTPDTFTDAINEYLYDNYGEVPAAYGLEIRLTDVTWE